MALPTLLTNQPQAGSIKWDAFGIQYDGISYPVPAGNTNKKYVYWDYDAGSQSQARINYVPNPGVGGSSTGFTGTNLPTLPVATGGPLANTGYVRGTFNGPRTLTATADICYLSATNAWGGQTISATSAMSPSSQWTASAYVRSSTAQTMRLQPQSINGSGAGTVPTINAGGGDVVVPANVWVRLWVTFTTPASGMSAVRLDLDAGSTGATFAQNDTIDMSMVMLEPVGTVLDPFHPGQPDTNLDSTLWLGEPHAGLSYMVSKTGLRNLSRDPGAANTVAQDGCAATWSGSGGSVNSARALNSTYFPSGKVLRASWTAAGTNATIQIANMKNVLTSHGTFTAIMEFRVNLGAVGSLPSGASLTEFGVGNTTVLASGRVDMGQGRYRVWSTFNITNLSTYTAQPNPRLDFGIGNMASGAIVDISTIAVFAGTYDPVERDWFWGNTGGLPKGKYTVWAGTPNASVSGRTEVAPGLVMVDVLPELAPEDMLLFLNKNGVGVLVPTTQVIEGSLIVSGSILADAIAANQIDAWHLRANSITANAIAAGAITSPAIAAGAITTEKLSVATVSDSMIANGSFEDLTQGWTVVQAGAGYIADVVTGVASSGANALRMIRNNVAGDEQDLIVGQDATMMVGVSPAALRRWYVACRAGAAAALTDGFYLRVYWYKGDRITPSDLNPITDVANNVALSTSWQLFEGQVVPPDDARYAQVALVNATQGSTMYVDEVVMHQVTVAAMIGDGEIQTPHIKAGAVTADTIAANAVGAEAIAAGSILTNHLTAGAIQTNHLSPAVGAEIDISANRAVNLIAADVVAVRDSVGNVTNQVSVMATALSVLPNAVEITQTNSEYKLSLTSNSVSIMKGLSTMSTWNESGLVADSFTGKSVVLGNHKIEAGNNGTIVKAL